MIDKKEIQAKFDAFQADLAKEAVASSDRGLVLVMINGLDYVLTEMLKAFFVADKPLVDDLFQSHGPLSTFSGKIKVCTALRLISKDESGYLDKFRSIRNKFAHDFGIGLENTSIASQCDYLHKNLSRANASAKTSFDKFNAAGVTLFVELLKRWTDALGDKRKAV